MPSQSPTPERVTSESLRPEAPPSESEGGSSVRLRMTVAYDGSGFRGFARQPQQRTVSGELARAISNFCRHDVEIVCAGRTDSGVHAQGQVIHVEVAGQTDPTALKRAINRQLAPEIVVRDASVTTDGFDARHSARARSYRYLILNAREPDPLLAKVAWHVADPLDIRSMRAASDALIGEHDFGAFCRRPPDYPKDAPINRRVLESSWVPAFEAGGRPGDKHSGNGVDRGDGKIGDGRAEEELWRFDIRATSFCHQMVRSIVAVLVEVGKGKMKPSDIPRLLQSGDRSTAKTPAPPHGLCLMRVEYDG